MWQSNADRSGVLFILYLVPCANAKKPEVVALWLGIVATVYDRYVARRDREMIITLAIVAAVMVPWLIFAAMSPPRQIWQGHVAHCMVFDGVLDCHEIGAIMELSLFDPNECSISIQRPQIMSREKWRRGKGVVVLYRDGNRVTEVTMGEDLTMIGMAWKPDIETEE